MTGWEGGSVGQYRIVRKIGEGGMGAVYLGRHVLLGRQAAVKILLPELSLQRASVDRFFNEARAITAIADPGIVQVFDFGVHTDGSAYIVMELLEGESLDARLARLGRLRPAEALRIARQCAGSLVAAHRCGIVHRDLKPENIFLVRDLEVPGGERAKILDFGIAKLGGDQPNTARTRTGVVIGTPTYMSPEQCRGAGSVDHRSDVYAMGCVLFHMLTGRPPFEADGVGELIAAHLREPPPAPSSVVPGLPAAIDELVLACLAKSLDQRMQTMQDLHRGCEAVIARITASGDGALAVATADLPAGWSTSGGGGSLVPPTTLGAAAGLAAARPRESTRRWTLSAVVALLVIGGAVATVAITGRGGGGASAARVEPSPPASTFVLDAGATVSAVALDAGAPAGPTSLDTDTDAATVADPPATDARDGSADAGPPRPEPERTRSSDHGRSRRATTGGATTGSGPGSKGDLYGDR